MTEDDLDDLVQKIAGAWDGSQTIHTMVPSILGVDRDDFSSRMQVKLQNRYPDSVVSVTPYPATEIKASKHPLK
ncbi:MAG TPA: hypothetical protein DIS96_19475 [Pusillimonas sp.]|nr:hypothetical protein [Pusillimonas sp.]